MYEDIKSKDI